MPRVVIKPVDPWWRINIKEIVRSKDLIWVLIKRDFITEYKQTVIGPAWFILQPLGATVIFTIIFGQVAKLGTDGIPPLIFYHSGLILWTFFQSCLIGTSGSLRKNAGLYQKVYFPRLISPLVEIFNGFWKYLLNFLIFLGFLFYYIIFTEADLSPTLAILITPLILLNTALLGMGTGLLFSSLTVKYRDFQFITPIFLQLWMYVSPVIYSSTMFSGKLKAIFFLNPMVSMLELNRYAYTGVGEISMGAHAYSTIASLIIFTIGLFLFNKVQQTFVDLI